MVLGSIHCIVGGLCGLLVAIALHNALGHHAHNVGRKFSDASGCARVPIVSEGRDTVKHIHGRECVNVAANGLENFDR